MGEMDGGPHRTMLTTVLSAAHLAKLYSTRTAAQTISSTRVNDAAPLPS